MSAVYYAVESLHPMFRLSMASAYAGLALLTASLLCGPWNVLRGRPNPVTTDLRRDIGIWAAFLGLAHMVVGLQVHMQGKFWLYFLYPADQPYLLRLRHDAFGFANFVGLGATLVLMLLLGLSNDLSLRTLGVKRWKALQRWNYVAFALMVAHSIVYQIIEKRTLPFLGLFSGLVFVAIIMQLMGFRRMRLRTGRGEGAGYQTASEASPVTPSNP